MSIIIGLIIFAAGALLGFFANKMFFSTNDDSNKLAEQANQSEANLAQYKLDVAEHLDNSAKLLEQMNATCQKAMEQMEQSTLLLKQATPTEAEAMPYFAKETQEQLAQTAALRHSKSERSHHEPRTEAPLDYSGEASGLFSDEKQTVTNPESRS